MLKRGVIVGGAALAGLAVVGVAWVFGGDTAEPARKGPPPTIAQLPSELGAPTDGRLPLQSIERITYYTVDGDRVMKLSAVKVLPKDDFISDLIEPRAEIRFGPDRLLVIEASEGTFYLPGNDPQRGEFRSDVVVTLYEATEGEDLDTLTDDRVAVRLFMDDPTSFDRDLGKLATEGPIYLTGPDVDFKGRGLLLLHNQTRARLERLVISEGEYLRLRRPAEDDAGTDDEPPHAASGGPEAEASESGAASRGATADATDDTPPSDADAETPPQFYQADFLGGVTVQVGQDEAELIGETLSAYFTLDLGDEDQGSAPVAHTDPANNQQARAIAPGPDGRPATTTTLTDAAPPLPVLPPRSLFTPHPDDVVVHWTQQLLVLPLDEAPDGLSDPEDAMLALTGTATNRASALTAADESITADEVRYFTSSRRVEAVASAAVPFVLNAPRQGTLTGARLILDPDEAAGTVFGPGRLLAFDPDETLTLEDAVAPQRRTVLDVAFQRRLDLAFDPDDTGNLEALRQATFLGDVRASGAGEQPDEQLDIDAQTLIVDLTRNAEGKTVPAKLTARREVLAQQPGRSIRADSFWVQFEEKPAGALSPDAGEHGKETPDTPGELDLLVTRARASGNVVVLAEADQTTLRADQLDAYPEDGRLVLIGTDGPARVVRPDATLTGDRLEFYEATETLHAPGPGTLTAPLDEDNPDAKLTVSWQTSLDFDGVADTAAVLGNVHATTTSATDRTRLESHRLDLTFAPKLDAEEQTPGVDGASDQARESLDLRQALATADPSDPAGTVVFAAQSFDPATPDEALTRLTLKGPSLRFVNHADANPPVEQVTVDGAGEMLLEDYRVKPEVEEPNDEATDTKASALELSGRGITYFMWGGSLLLDAQANDMTMVNDVRMVHDPLDGEPRVKLFGDRLTADLTETGGLGAWVADDAPKAELRRVQLDGNVLVTQDGRTITADHLRYVESSRDVWVWCDRGRRVRVEDENNRRNNVEARYIKWNLDRDRITVAKPRGGVIPIE